MTTKGDDMTANDDFNRDNDDVDRPAEDVNENFVAGAGTGDDAADPTGSASDGSRDVLGAADEDTIGSAADEAADGTVLDETRDDAGSDGDRADGDGESSANGSKTADDSDVDLPQLLRQVSRVLRREFRAAANDSGFDPRDFGRMRRGRRGWDGEEMVADGAPGPEEPVTYGPPRGRRGWGPAGDVSPEELRRRMHDLREGLGEKVEEVLSSEEFEDLKASLTKIVDAFGPDRCGDEPRRGGRDDRDGRDRRHDRERWHRHDHGDGGRGDFRGDHGHDGHGGEHEGHRGGPDRGGRHGEGRGRRGFGPGFGPGFGGGFGGGFGPGRRGFDPFGWAEDRRDRERDHDREVQEAFERGFAAGFEQGRNS